MAHEVYMIEVLEESDVIVYLIFPDDVVLL